MLKLTNSEQSQVEQPKEKYRIINWAAYNEALVKRGSLTIYFAQ